MPNRILKDSICTSPNIDTLSREAEVFFYRLLVQCDDHGRTVTALAHDAGVSVDYVHVDLTKQASERRIVEAKEESHP